MMTAPGTRRIGDATVTPTEESSGPAYRPHDLLATWDGAVLDEHPDDVDFVL
jgi:hypothetical protein